MIYKIKDEYLEVINYCNEYDEYIFKRFSQFEIVTNKEINNYLRFNETSVEININGDYKILKNRKGNKKIMKTKQEKYGQ